MEKRNVVIVGGGIGGLGAAALLSSRGYAVTVVEKNARLGGVCNLIQEEGFTFDTGPSWYMMPWAYEEFFKLCGEDVSEHLSLVRLDPSSRIFFEGREKPFDLSSDLVRDREIFESLEQGSFEKVKQYIEEGWHKYELAEKFFLRSSGRSVLDFIKPEMIRALPRLGLLSSIQSDLERRFSSPEMRALLMLHASFVGGQPRSTPALFSFMSAVDVKGGIWYPMGGMYEIVEALVRIGEKHGVKYRTNSPVASIEVSGSLARGVTLATGERIDADIVVSNADVSFTEQKLLSESARQWSAKKWEKTKPSFSVLLLFLGVKGRVPELAHHNVHFTTDWDAHFRDLASGVFNPKPSVYLGAPSRTDASVAPADHENLFVLVPIPGGCSSRDMRFEKYADEMLAHTEKSFKIPNLRSRIVYKKLYGGADFSRDYNSFPGSALGPAHTLFQSAIWRPYNQSAEVKNLFYVGASTNPGIGVPTCLISAERVANLVKESELQV